MPGTKIYYISGPQRTARVGLNFNGTPITAQSTPVLDGWGWGDYWQCADWKAWHIELRKQYSAQQAALIFTQAWNQQDSFANPYNWCKYNADFRNYMRTQGVDIDSIVSAIIMPVFDAAGNLAQNSGDIVSNVSSAAGTLSKLAVPALLVAGFFGAKYVYKNYLK